MFLARLIRRPFWSLVLGATTPPLAILILFACYTFYQWSRLDIMLWAFFLPALLFGTAWLVGIGLATSLLLPRPQRSRPRFAIGLGLSLGIYAAFFIKAFG